MNVQIGLDSECWVWMDEHEDICAATVAYEVTDEFCGTTSTMLLCEAHTRQWRESGYTVAVRRLRPAEVR